jgi:cold shock CspA family protein
MVDGPIPSEGPRLGRVTSFDQRRGLGTVKDLATGVEYPFHATAIADGSRSIAEQRSVVFTVTPGHGGRYEAQSIVIDASAP